MFTAKSSLVVSPSERSNAPHGPLPGAIVRSVSTRPWSCVRSLPLPSKPRVPLLSGSVLVLLTLFLPVAYSQCGSVRWTGSNYLLGFGTWPGSLGALSYAAGRVPYFITLLLAALTLLLVLAAMIRPSFLRKSDITARLFIASGTLSLFMIGDFFWFRLGSRIGSLFDSGLTQSGQNLFMMMLADFMLVGLATCLSSRFLRRQRWIAWLLGIAGGISLFMMVNYFLAWCGASPLISSGWALFLTISPSILYFVVPLGLWCQFGLARQVGLQEQWLGIRRRIALLYLPAVAFDLFVLVLEAKPGRLWGLLPYFAGLGLIFWGYAALERLPNFAVKILQGGAWELTAAEPSQQMLSESGEAKLITKA